MDLMCCVRALGLHNKSTEYSCILSVHTFTSGLVSGVFFFLGDVHGRGANADGWLLCRGVHEVVFYSLPQHADFYLDIVNMATARSVDLLCSAQALVSKYDYLPMRRIIGDKRAKRIASADAKSFLFQTM